MRRDLRLPGRIRGGIGLGGAVVNGRVGPRWLLGYGFELGGLIIGSRGVAVIGIRIVIDRRRSGR